ncbi:NAD-dependent epimerase/dehydratase family protein [Candidatus Parcubacteria bacterium]|nr:NAD-dependent epimerase/dehydratase family protein [Candidatus Parcubacteria bacterium]
MHILITGSSGEIGTNLALKLAKMGHRVTGVDKRLNVWTNAFPHILQDLSQKYKNFKGGIGYTKYPDDIDLVVHLAANAKVHELVEHPLRALDNITVTFNVLEFCRQSNLPIIYASSREVYADIQRYTTNEEQSNFRYTESPYSASKISGEALIYSYAKCYDLPYIVFRFSNVYGRYDCDIERMERVIPLFIKKIENGEEIRIFGKDKSLDFTYVDDCIAGIVSGVEKLKSGEVKNKTINLAYGEGNTLVKMAEYIGEALGKKVDMKFEDSKVGEVTHYVADIGKARELLGYNPQTALKEGIGKTVEWWLKEGRRKLITTGEISKKKIVIFSTFYEPFMSGAELFVKEVNERLSDKYDITIITAKLRPDLAQEEDFGGYKVVRVGKGNKLDKIRYIWLAPQMARKLNPSLLHAVMESYAGLALWFSKYIMPDKKRILTLQSGDLDAKIWSKIPILWSGIHRSPDFITAISNFLGERATRLGASNVEIIPNGVDLKEAEDTLINKNNSEKRHRIVCLARLSWEKDHKNLLSAMPSILNRFPDAELILVGDGPLKESLQRTAYGLQLGDRVKFLGNLPHKTALEELAKADVSICPSLAEGLGITFIEAQILGVPIIGTRVGGIPDVIEDGKTGILINPASAKDIAEAIIKIFEMEENEKNIMIEEAKKSARDKFDWDKIAIQVDSLYNKLLLR